MTKYARCSYHKRRVQQLAQLQVAACCVRCCSYDQDCIVENAATSTNTAAIVCGHFTRVCDTSSLPTFTSALASSGASFRPRFCVRSVANHPCHMTIVARVYHPVSHCRHFVRSSLWSSVSGICKPSTVAALVASPYHRVLQGDLP